MSDRHVIRREYKERRHRGGVYTITNTVTGQYLLDYAADLESAHNRFQFAVTTSATMHPRLRKDWEALGACAFRFEVCEELDQRPGQSQAEFMDDLKTLAQLWDAQLDTAKAY